MLHFCINIQSSFAENHIVDLGKSKPHYIPDDIWERMTTAATMHTEKLEQEAAELKLKYEAPVNTHNLNEAHQFQLQKDDVKNPKALRSWYNQQLDKYESDDSSTDDIHIIYQWYLQNTRMGGKLKTEKNNSEYWLQCTLFTHLLDSPLFRYRTQAMSRRFALKFYVLQLIPVLEDSEEASTLSFGKRNLFQIGPWQ